jgi:hypothetical protein
MADRRFIILWYVGAVPAMASCTNCQRKFFSPATLLRDAIAAESYLAHSSMCISAQKSQRRWAERAVAAG